MPGFPIMFLMPFSEDIFLKAEGARDHPPPTDPPSHELSRITGQETLDCSMVQQPSDNAGRRGKHGCT